MLAVRDPHAARFGELEVVADLEAADRAPLDALDGDAEVVERHRRVGHGRSVSRSARLGAWRIDGLSVPHTASSRPHPVNTATVARADTDVSRKPALSGPSDATSNAMLLRTLSTRPRIRSGVIATQYPSTTESVTGNVTASGRMLAVRT